VAPNMNADKPLSDSAAAALNMDFSIFPCTPGDKKPLTGSRGFYDATKDANQVSEWWRQNPNFNIGIACGDSNLTVVDADTGFDSFETAESWRIRNGLPASFAVRTGRRPEFGIQWY
jgi:hypothetical protein